MRPTKAHVFAPLNSNSLFRSTLLPKSKRQERALSAERQGQLLIARGRKTPNEFKLFLTKAVQIVFTHAALLQQSGKDKREHRVPIIVLAIDSQTTVRQPTFEIPQVSGLLRSSRMEIPGFWYSGIRCRSKSRAANETSKRERSPRRALFRLVQEDSLT